MYGGYTTTAIALRAKSSFSYAPLPFFTERGDHCRGDFSPCAHFSHHGFSINPRFLLYGYCSRQSSLIYWSPSRSFLSSRAADRARCRRSAVRELGLGPQCRRTSSWSRTSDGGFWEMIGLLAEVRSCYREGYSAEESRNEAGCDKVVSLGKNLRREVEIESVDGEGWRSSRARKDGSELDCYSGSERKEGKGRRVCGDSSRNYGSGRVDIGDREVRQVRKYEDNAGSKKRYVSESDAGWDSSRKTEFQEKDGNLRASSSTKLSEWEIRDREEKAASLRRSRCEAREEPGYEEQNVAGQEGSWRLTRMSGVGENDARTGLSSKNMAGARKVDREEGSGSAGKWQGKVDKRVVGRTGWKAEEREERGALGMDSAHEAREVCDYKEENVYGERVLREGSRKIARKRTSEAHGDDSTRFSSFQSAVDARKVDREEGLAARQRSEIDQRVVGQAELRFADRDEKGASSIDLALEAREEYGYEDEWVVRQRESRPGSRMVTGTSDVHEDDTKRSSSSKNMGDARKVGWEVSSTSNKHTELDQGVVGRTELRKRSQKPREITQLRDKNTESASDSQRHYEQMWVRNREDRSASAQSSVPVSRDKRSQRDQWVLGRMETDKHNESRTDVSSARAGDAERASSSRRLLETRMDDPEDYSARNQWNLINEQFMQQSSSRRTHERDAQNFEVSRRDTERASNTQEIYNTRYNTRVESESVNCEYSSRRDSAKETNISEYSRNDNEMASTSQEISNMRIENRRGNSSSMLVRDKLGKQRSTLTGDSSQPTKGQMGFTGRFDSGTSSLNTYTHELDDQASRGEMYIIKDGSLESASRSDRSSALYVGEFVDKVQQEITTLDGLDYASKYSPGIQIEEVPSGASNATSGTPSRLPAAASEDKDERYVEEGSRRSTSKPGMKGPSDEMWDVRGLTSQETSRTEEPEEGPTAAEAEDSTTATAGTENAVAQRSHRSLWSYVADIIRLSWGLHAESRNPALKSGTRCSSNESVSSEAWFSGQEPDDNDEIDEKRSGTPKEPLLTKRPLDESYPRTHAGPSEGSFGVPQLGDRVVKSEAGTSTSTGITKTGSLAKGSSTVSIPEEVGWTEGEKGREGIPSNVITVDQSSALTDDTAPAIIEEDKTNIGNVPLPVSKFTRLEEKLVREGSPEVGKPDGKDGELKRRKLQRNKQVLKERFDEWEEAYRLESEQRKTDEFFMREALAEARKAADTWEVPVGAVLVQNGKIIARGCNLVEGLRDSTAHAEMICIREASNLLRTWRLAETTLYVTLEPCPMCAGAILQARIDTVVWGAPNKLLGADGSWVRLFPGDGGSSSLDSSNQIVGPVHPFHPSITIRRGVLATECSEAMQQFFQLRRRKNKKPEPSLPPVSTHPTKFFTKIHDLFSVMFCL
ncbi:tRNA(adenine(34)) deaminase, chloroplastic [Phoenix dactylifera]|uniref:tRNA(adenine(34)) deaminase n=1 Tax=Phoenix dactylifera TaxID=42345 RepID=A0A8B7BP69_PHODC|nr:tRNA(adenine(34)) deaminase, chloroplastic [Phoenix dactylifera]